MVSKVVMPRLSLTMKEGTVGKWYKKEGEAVEKDEPIVEVISEKATYDLEAPASGMLGKILVAEGSNAQVDQALAIILSPGETLTEEQLQQQTEALQAVKITEERVAASPAAKRLAKERGIDISLVRGSGPEGRITEEDVERHLQETGGVFPRTKRMIPLTGFRKISAERVTVSFRTAPHSTLTMEVDASEMTQAHKRLQVSFTALISKAVADALIEHPELNSTLDGDNIRILEDVNIGVAVATENGLVVPVIRNVDQKSVRDIESEIVELDDKSKRGRLAKEDVSGGTFTVSNLGMYGVDFFTPIINPPQAAILGVGRIAEKPVVVDGKVAVRPLIVLSLSYDHRIVDGAPAAAFLRKIKQKLEASEPKG